MQERGGRKANVACPGEALHRRRVVFGDREDVAGIGLLQREAIDDAQKISDANERMCSKQAVAWTEGNALPNVVSEVRRVKRCAWDARAFQIFPNLSLVWLMSVSSRVGSAVEEILRSI